MCGAAAAVQIAVSQSIAEVAQPCSQGIAQPRSQDVTQPRSQDVTQPCSQGICVCVSAWP
jgi:hypothetical protein